MNIRRGEIIQIDIAQSFTEELTPGKLNSFRDHPAVKSPME